MINVKCQTFLITLKSKTSRKWYQSKNYYIEDRKSFVKRRQILSALSELISKKKKKTNKPNRRSNLLSLAPISFILLSIRGVAYTARLYADAMLHNTKASSVDSLSLSLLPPSPPLSVSYLILSKDWPRIF